MQVKCSNEMQASHDKAWNGSAKQVDSKDTEYECTAGKPADIDMLFYILSIKEEQMICNLINTAGEGICF